eukprot:COSAG02_NODE_1293_length_13410_cov_13.392004_7_plen_100_part_00
MKMTSRKSTVLVRVLFVSADRPPVLKSHFVWKHCIVNARNVRHLISVRACGIVPCVPVQHMYRFRNNLINMILPYRTHWGASALAARGGGGGARIRYGL